jgi:ribosomal protein S18 acetylase RimI-like enzyme
MPMNQDLFSVLSLLTSMVLSIAAVAVSLYTLQKQTLEHSYSDIDKAYARILELAIATPALRDWQQTTTYFRKPHHDAYRIQYESYAYLCWNLIETIYDRQADQRARLGVSATWLPVVIEESRLHYHWFCRNTRLFKDEFHRFIMHQLNDVIVRQGTPADLDTLYPSLVRDFPAGELKSRAQFDHLLARGQYKLYLAKHAASGTDVGYAFVYEPTASAIAWLDYIAIDPQLRNSGFGTAFFNKLCETLGSRLGMMLEVEPPTSTNADELENQRRRIAFYERIGAKRLHVTYYFPAQEGPLPMLLFFRPIAARGTLPKEHIQAMIKAVYDYIHDDVAHRFDILNSFIGQVTDHPL